MGIVIHNNRNLDVSYTITHVDATNTGSTISVCCKSEIIIADGETISFSDIDNSGKPLELFVIGIIAVGRLKGFVLQAGSNSNNGLVGKIRKNDANLSDLPGSVLMHVGEPNNSVSKSDNNGDYKLPSVIKNNQNKIQIHSIVLGTNPIILDVTPTNNGDKLDVVFDDSVPMIGGNE